MSSVGNVNWPSVSCSAVTGLTCMQTLQRCFHLRSYREQVRRQGLLQENKVKIEVSSFGSLNTNCAFPHPPFVLNLHPLCCPQETTTGRRPTIQTTVTASLTKYSPGACNQMSPVKFASKFCAKCQKLCNKKSHLSFFFFSFCLLMEACITSYSPLFTTFTPSSIICPSPP